MVWDPTGTCKENDQVGSGGSGYGDAKPADSASVTNPKPLGAQKPANKAKPVAGSSANNQPDTSSNLIADTDEPMDEPPCPAFWVLGYGYVEGDTVGAQGQIYRCKGYPETGEFVNGHQQMKTWAF